MNRKLHRNPAAVLKNLIATRGRSGHHATEHYGASVEFNAEEQAHSDTFDDSLSVMRQWAEEDESYKKFITVLTHGDRINYTFLLDHYFGMEGVCINYRGEKGGLGRTTVTFPQVNASKIDVDIEIFSHVARHFGRLLGTESNEVCFFVCFSFLRWEDMEEEKLLYAEIDSD